MACHTISGIISATLSAGNTRLESDFRFHAPLVQRNKVWNAVHARHESIMNLKPLYFQKISQILALHPVGSPDRSLLLIERLEYTYPDAFFQPIVSCLEPFKIKPRCST